MTLRSATARGFLKSVNSALSGNMTVSVTRASRVGVLRPGHEASQRGTGCILLTMNRHRALILLLYRLAAPITQRTSSRASHSPSR